MFVRTVVIKVIQIVEISPQQKGGGNHKIILIVIIKAYITISSDCKVLNLGMLENFSDLKEIGGFKILELDKSFPYKRVFNKNHGKPLSTNQAG